MRGAKRAVQLCCTSDLQRRSAPKVGDSNVHVICEQALGNSFHQNGYKMKSMNFPDRLGQRRRYSRSYSHDEPQRQAGKGTILCKCFGETGY